MFIRISNWALKHKKKGTELRLIEITSKWNI